MTHPTIQARDIATLIDNDPIMASQIKEFMRLERLRECLGLPSTTGELEDYTLRELHEEIDRRLED